MVVTWDKHSSIKPFWWSLKFGFSRAQRSLLGDALWIWNMRGSFREKKIGRRLSGKFGWQVKSSNNQVADLDGHLASKLPMVNEDSSLKSSRQELPVEFSWNLLSVTLIFCLDSVRRMLGPCTTIFAVALDAFRENVSLKTVSRTI